MRIPTRAAGPLAALAAAAGLVAAAPAAAQTMVLPVNHSSRLTIQGEAASVVVGNPAIADVSVVDSHTIYVSAKGVGQTDVTVLDALGRPLYTSVVSVGTSAPGYVAVFRGPRRVDFNCTPSCDALPVANGSEDGGRNAGRTITGQGNGGNGAGVLNPVGGGGP